MGSWQPGSVLAGKYEIVSALGSGGFGSAYKARHLHLANHYYVIKRLHEQLAADPDAVRRFRKEANKLLRLKGCPNVVEIHDLEDIDGSPALVMTFIDGSPMKATKPPSSEIDSLLRLVRGIARGLAATHAAGLVHLDIKPENILIESSTGEPRIIDFGISADLSGTTSLVIGASPGFAPPEQYLIGTTGRSIKELDARTDIYSLGILLYLYLTGIMPYANTDYMQLMNLQARADPPSNLRAGVNDWAGLDSLCLGMIEPNRETRIRSASEVIRCIDMMLPSASVSPMFGDWRKYYAGVLSKIQEMEVEDREHQDRYEALSLPHWIIEEAARAEAKMPVPMQYVDQVPELGALRERAAAARAGVEQSDRILEKFKQFSMSFERALLERRWAEAGSQLRNHSAEAWFRGTESGFQARLRSALTKAAAVELELLTAILQNPYAKADALEALQEWHWPSPAGENTWQQFEEIRRLFLNGKYDQALSVSPGTFPTVEETIRKKASDGRRTRNKNLLQGAAGLLIFLGLVAGRLVLSRYFDSRPVSAPQQNITSTPVQTRENAVNQKDGLTYIRIPAGTFQMGCSANDDECLGRERPARPITLTRDFWIGQTEVTQEAYKRVMKGADPSQFKGPRHPVEKVTWREAQLFCRSIGGQLPTDAQWEMAARGGSVRPRHGVVARIGWYSKNSVYQSHEVAKLAPNGYGLYDMLGNVWEWTADSWSGLPNGTDPVATGSGDTRVIRGGSYYSNPVDLRVSSRYFAAGTTRDYSIGFRCVWEN